MEQEEASHTATKGREQARKIPPYGPSKKTRQVAYLPMSALLEFSLVKTLEFAVLLWRQEKI